MISAFNRKPLVGACLLLITIDAPGQGAFQNLDFENGAFVPIPGGHPGQAEWGSAMPGWTGYWGTNQTDSIHYNLNPPSKLPIVA